MNRGHEVSAALNLGSFANSSHDFPVKEPVLRVICPFEDVRRSLAVGVSSIPERSARWGHIYRGTLPGDRKSGRTLQTKGAG